MLHKTTSHTASTAEELPFGVPRQPLRAVGSNLIWTWSKGRSSGSLLAARQVLSIASAVHDPTLDEAVALVGSHLATMHDLAEQSIQRLLTEIGRFAVRLQLNGVGTLGAVSEDDCRLFIEQAVQTRSGAWEHPATSTQHLRRTAVRLLYATARHLQLASSDPTLDLVLPPRSTRCAARPLTDDEEALGRVWARLTVDGTRHSAAWALGQATATGTEQASVTVRDLDLSKARVWLWGNESKREPRWGALTDWGSEQIDRRIHAIGHEPSSPLLASSGSSRNSAQATVCNAVSQILFRAGLRSDRTIRPASLPAWAGRRVFDATDRIDEVAHALGIRSLDRAAEAIGWEW